MTTFKIITGRAGSGKSSYCIESMAEYIKKRDGDIGVAPAFLIVPEQFAVNSEKRLMSEANLPGLMIDEVLSFKRAACRVLGRCGGLKYELLSPSGKVMLLTQAVRNLSEELGFYGSYSSKPRGMEGLLNLIDEFGRYNLSAEKIAEIASKEDTDTLLKTKLSDLSKIYQEYRKLTASRFYDGETLYNDFIKYLPNDEMFRHSHVWIDGFNGFTAQEFEIIRALIDVCDEISISICADSSDKNVFENSNTTVCKLLNIADEFGIKPIVKQLCKDEVPYRFRNNKYLAHFENNYGRFPYQPLSGSNTGISVCECKNRYYETEESAAKIKSFVKEGYKYSDIAVISGNLEQYKNILGAVFYAHGIPFFMDEKRQITSHPLVRYVICLLELTSANWSYISVFSFLKTGLYETDMSLVDKLENEILEKGIKGKSGVKGWSKFAEYCKSEISDASLCGNVQKKSIAAKVLAVKLFNDIESFREKLKAARSVSECCDLIIQFLIKNDVYDKVSNIAARLRSEGRMDDADEYSGIWNIVVDVIEQADVFMGEKELRGINVKARYVADVLSNGFAQYKAGFIPHSNDCVQIGTPERSKSLNPKILVLIGANEGVFPSTIKDNGILTDGDRDVLLQNGIELSDDNKKRALYAEFVTYTAMTTPSDKIFITYSLASSAGEAMRPSSVIRKILKLFPDTVVEIGKTAFVKKQSAMQYSDFFTSDYSISQDLSEKLLKFDSEKPVTSVSRITTYNECPYSFMLKYCLNLKPRKEFSMEVSDIGTLLHGIIENSFKKVTEDKNRRESLSYDECSNIVEGVFCDVVDSIDNGTAIFESTARNAYITSRIKRIAEKELKNLVGQLSLNHLNPIGFEVEYGIAEDKALPPVNVMCDDGFTVALEGKIDRIDAGLLRTEDLKEYEDTPVYFRVIDYKSSHHDLKVDDIVNGRNLQLIVYVAAVKDGLPYVDGFNDRRAIPAAALYYGFEKNNIDLDAESPEDIDAIEKENYMSGLFLAKEDALHSLHGGVYDLPKKNILTNAKAVPDGGFDKLTELAKMKIAESVSSMKSGRFPAKPFSDLKGCKYCKFKPVCRINTSDSKNIKNTISISADAFWERKE